MPVCEARDDPEARDLTPMLSNQNQWRLAA